MKKKTLKTIAFLLLSVMAVALLASCTVSKYYEGAPDGMRPICDGSEGAILYVPASWQVDTSTGIPTAYYSTNDRSTVTLIKVGADELDGKDAKSYWESYKATFASTLTDFAVSKESETEKDYTTRLIANVGAYVFDFTAKVTGIDFKFRQALFCNTAGDLYIITYSAQVGVFDSHTEDITAVFDNFKFVTEVTPMADKTEIKLPEAEGINVPDGYILLSGKHVDYTLFVPENWVPLVTTAMSAASAPDKSNVTVNAMAFTANATSIDDFWTGYEEDIDLTYGAVTFPDPENKYEELTLDGYKIRKYVFSVQVTGETYRYDQYVHVNGGYAVMLTCACPSADYEAYKDTFDGIVANFGYK